MNKTKQKITFETWSKTYAMVYKKVKEYCGNPELDVNKVRRLADASHLSFRNMLLGRLESLDAFEAYSWDELNRLNIGVDWLIKDEKMERK